MDVEIAKGWDQAMGGRLPFQERRHFKAILSFTPYEAMLAREATLPAAAPVAKHKAHSLSSSIARPGRTQGVPVPTQKLSSSSSTDKQNPLQHTSQQIHLEQLDTARVYMCLNVCILIDLHVCIYIYIYIYVFIYLFI